MSRCALCGDEERLQYRGYVGIGEDGLSGRSDDAICSQCLEAELRAAWLAPEAIAWMVAHSRHFFAGVRDPACPNCVPS